MSGQFSDRRDVTVTSPTPARWFRVADAAKTPRDWATVATIAGAAIVGLTVMAGVGLVGAVIVARGEGL